MRIAYVASGYMPRLGGVERHVAELATRMAAVGHFVEVLVPQNDRRLPRTEIMNGVGVRRLPGGPRGAAWHAWAVVRDCRRYDVVHAHNYHGLPALAPALASAHPLVFTPHYLGTGSGLSLRALHAAYRPVGRFVLTRADRVICVSRAEAALLREDFPRLSTLITVVPNGVDVVGLRSAQPHPVEGTAILTAGRLERYKNVRLAIEAMTRLDSRFRLYVAGDGPEHGALKRLARRLRLERRVTFLGHLMPVELYRWYRTARVYVTVSPRECFGITLLEALAAGASAVASDIPAHREVVQETGRRAVALVAPNGPASELAEAIQSMAETVDTTPPAAPTWDHVAERHLTLYESLTQASERHAVRFD